MNLSLKYRLAALVAVATAGIGAVSVWAIWTTAESGARERTDAMLRSPGRRLTERTGWNTDWRRFDQSLALVFGDDWKRTGICRVVGGGPRFPVYYESDNWPEDLVIRSAPGDRDFAATQPAAEGLLPVRPPFFYDATTWPEARWRMVHLANRELTIHLGIRTDDRLGDSRRLAVALATGVALLSALMFFVAWLVARQALRPVTAIAATAAEITERQLDRRINERERTDREFATLIRVFNEMIGRLERGFHQAARFSADASHELRTPITNLYGEVTARLRDCAPGSEEQRFLAGVVDELDRLRAVLEGLLLLSRADGGRMELSRERVVAADFLGTLNQDFVVMVEAAGLRFEQVGDCDGAILEIDPVMLTQVLHNLIRNAIDYNRPDGFVRMETFSGEEELVISVINSGEPIEASLRDAVFDRFRRGPHGRHGLGLNIVKEVIEAHGGKVVLVASTGEETVFSLYLPVAKASQGAGK